MMKNDNNKNGNFPNLPLLRFPEFEGEWEVKKLGEVSKFSKGKGISKNDIVDDGINECIRYGELYTIYNELINVIYSKTNVEKSKSVLSEINDVIIPSSGETQLDIARASCVLKKGVILGGDLNIIKSKKNGIFLSYYLNSKKKISIARLSQGNSVVHLYSKQLASLDVFFPSFSEQTKIANFLSKLDERIHLQREIIEELRLLFKGVQKKVYNNGTKKVKIEKILTEVNEKTTINNQYEVLSSTVKGIFKQSEYFDRKVASENNIGYKILKEKQVVLSPQNLWMGNINYNDEFEIGIVSPSYKVFNINDEHNKIYIAYLLKSHRAFYEYMNTSEQGASVVRRNLNMHLFNEISFVVPQKKEQDKIAKALSSFSEKLKTEQELLSAYEQQKKYFLQNMFC